MYIKIIIPLVFLLLNCQITKSQDIIFKNDGSEIRATVIDIEDKDIKYKNFNQPEGPLRRISKFVVLMIKYQDGSIEKFNLIHKSHNDSVIVQGTVISERESEVYLVTLIKGWKVDLFHQNKYIGEVKSKEYIHYHCKSGNNLFWASTENKEFLTADLKEGCSYIVLIRPINAAGFWKAHVELFPLSPENDKYYHKAIKLIKSKEPVYFSAEEIDKMNAKLKSFININLKKYENEWKGIRNYKHLSSELCVPKDEFKQ